MKKILLIALLFVAFKGIAQDKVLPGEAKPFILNGYEMMDYIKGDLNADKRPDAILILKVKGEDTLTGDSLKRPFILLLRQPNGKLKFATRNDDMVLCRQCGGVFGDPYAGTKIKHNGFTLNFYGGSSWRWAYEYRFNYNASKKNWMLTGERQDNYQSGDPETTMKETIIGAEELSEINFNSFNGNPAYEGSKWKVTAVKTFFYDNPRIGSKPRRGFLLKDNEVTCLRELKNFAEVSFENTAAQFTTGFVLKKDLVKIK